MASKLETITFKSDGTVEIDGKAVGGDFVAIRTFDVIAGRRHMGVVFHFDKPVTLTTKDVLFDKKIPHMLDPKQPSPTLTTGKTFFLEVVNRYADFGQYMTGEKYVISAFTTENMFPTKDSLGAVVYDVDPKIVHDLAVVGSYYAQGYPDEAPYAGLTTKGSGRNGVRVHFHPSITNRCHHQSH